MSDGPVVLGSLRENAATWAELAAQRKDLLDEVKQHEAALATARTHLADVERMENDAWEALLDARTNLNPRPVA